MVALFDIFTKSYKMSIAQRTRDIHQAQHYNNIDEAERLISNIAQLSGGLCRWEIHVVQNVKLSDLIHK